MSAVAVVSCVVRSVEDSVSANEGVISQSILNEATVSIDARDNGLDELPGFSSVMESEGVDSPATAASVDDSAFVPPKPPWQSRSSRRDSARGEGGSQYKSCSRSGQGGHQGMPSPSPGRHRMPQSVAATPPRRVSSS